MPLLTHSALLRALGWSLFNSLWQMSLLWVTFHFFLLVFSRFSARARHGLALFVLLVGTGWSLLTFVTAYCFPENIPHESQWLSTLLPSAAIASRLSRFGHWLIVAALPCVSSVYLLILSGLLLRYFRHYNRSVQIKRTELSAIPCAFSVFTTSTARQMGIRATVGIYLSSLVDVPVTLGFLKPVILLPVAMLTNLRTEQVEAILVHELAHIQRKDYLLNLVIMVVELLFFFNPFTRLLIARLRKEREHCCDDQVLAFRYDPHAYVSALLSLAKQHGQGRLAMAAIGGSDQLLLERARTMLQQKKQVDRPGPRALCVLFLLLLGIFSLGISVGASVDPAPPARNSMGLSGDRIQAPTPFRALRLFTPVSMGSTRVVKTSLVNMVAAEIRPAMITPASRPIAMRHIARPGAVKASNMLVIQLSGTGAELAATRTGLGDLHAEFSDPNATLPFPRTGPAGPDADLAAGFRVRLTDSNGNPAGFNGQLNDPDADLAAGFRVRLTDSNGNLAGFNGQLDDPDADLAGPNIQLADSNGNLAALSIQLADPGTDPLSFLPTSNFAFQYTDTASWKAKLVWMEMMAEKAFRIQVLQLQAELRTDLVYLREQQANAQKAINVQMRTDPARRIGKDPTKEQLLKEFLRRQFQLQQQYQDRLDNLQRQWLKTGRRITIVYI